MFGDVVVEFSSLLFEGSQSLRLFRDRTARFFLQHPELLQRLQDLDPALLGAAVLFVESLKFERHCVEALKCLFRLRFDNLIFSFADRNVSPGCLQFAAGGRDILFTCLDF